MWRVGAYLVLMLAISFPSIARESYLKQSDALLEQGDYQQALQYYEKALKLDPKNARAWNNKGKALGWLGRDEEAIKSYEKAIELDPKYAPTWDNKGWALDRLDRDEEAIICFDKALGLDPKDAQTWEGKAMSLGRHEEAIKSYEKAIELDPKNIYGMVQQERGTARSGQVRGVLSLPGQGTKA